MRTALITFAFAAFAAASPAPAPVPAGVSSAIAPSSSPPPGCSENYIGGFGIAPINVTRKRDLESVSLFSRQEDHNQLGIELHNGILTDSQGRTGYIAANQQFQFDDPPQAGAIYTAGFSVCQNGSLSLGGTSIWYRCLSGAGSTHPGGDFFNLYFEDIGSVCIQSFLLARPVEAGDGPGPASGAPGSATSAALSSTAAANASSSAVLSSSSSVPVNGTASVSSSSGASASSSSSSATGPTLIGHTTGLQTGGPRTTAGPTGAQTGSNAAASSSSSSAGAGSLQGEMFGGLAAALLAFAAML